MGADRFLVLKIASFAAYIVRRVPRMPVCWNGTSVSLEALQRLRGVWEHVITRSKKITSVGAAVGEDPIGVGLDMELTGREC